MIPSDASNFVVAEPVGHAGGSNDIYGFKRPECVGCLLSHWHADVDKPLNTVPIPSDSEFDAQRRTISCRSSNAQFEKLLFHFSACVLCKGNDTLMSVSNDV